MHAHCHGSDNGVGATATAAEHPVEISVVARRPAHEPAVYANGVPHEHVVGGKAVQQRERGVAAALA